MAEVLKVKIIEISKKEAYEVVKNNGPEGMFITRDFVRGMGFWAAIKIVDGKVEVFNFINKRRAQMFLKGMIEYDSYRDDPLREMDFSKNYDFNKDIYEKQDDKFFPDSYNMLHKNHDL